MGLGDVRGRAAGHRRSSSRWVGRAMVPPKLGMEVRACPVSGRPGGPPFRSHQASPCAYSHLQISFSPAVWLSVCCENQQQSKARCQLDSQPGSPVPASELCTVRTNGRGQWVQCHCGDQFESLERGSEQLLYHNHKTNPGKPLFTIPLQDQYFVNII